MPRDKPNVALIGFMGCGKTTVGRLLAARRGFDFIDTDAFVERQSGKPISAIFEESGEAHFRDLEAAAVLSAASGTNRVIATGGGALKRAANTDALKARCTVVYLRVSPKQVLARLQDDDTRPLLQSPDKAQTIAKLLAERDPIYTATADITIETDNLTAEEVTLLLLSGFRLQ